MSKVKYRNPMNKPICTDDFGGLVHRCGYSKVIVFCDDAIWLGPIMPSLPASTGYWCHKTHGPPARIEAKLSFDQFDQNCNTCKHLVRIKHDKCKFGFLQGSCSKKNITSMKFHPDDPMFMDCHEIRRNRQGATA